MKQLIATAGLLTLALSACTPATTGPGATPMPFKQGEVWELNYTTAQGPQKYTFTLTQPDNAVPSQQLWHWSAAGQVEAGFNYAGRPASGLPYVSVVWYPGGSKVAQVCSQVRPTPDGSANTFTGYWTANMEQLGAYQASGNPAGLPACTLTRIKPAP